MTAIGARFQSLVVGQHNTSGAPVEISEIIGVYLAGGNTGFAYKVFNINIPFSTSVLDTTHAQQMPGAAAIRMAAGHAIAFEATNSNRLAYDAATNTLRWYQGTLSYAVGKGIAVGSVSVQSSNTTLPNYLSGNIVYLVGSAPYTITLPAASTRFIRDRFHIFRARFCSRNHRDDRKRHDRWQPGYTPAERSLPRRLGWGFELA